MTTGVDVEAVLRDHEIRWLGAVRPRAKCGAPECDWAAALLTGDAVEDAHRAHVAAVLREHIDSALGDAWDEGAQTVTSAVEFVLAPRDPFATSHTSRERAALAAARGPHRAPQEK